MRIEAIGLRGIPDIRPGDNLAEIILDAIERNNLKLEDGDIIAITEKVVSKSEGRLLRLDEIKPSDRAVELSKKTGKDPRIVEAILGESRDILGVGENFIVVETNHGFICANAGVDQSNVEEGMLKLLPTDPDRSAEEIRRRLEKETGKKLGVIIVDSWGRPFRYGSVGFAVGASGVRMLWDRRGEKDLYGRRLEVTRVAVGDCLASLASLVFGEAGEGVPCAVIRGFNLEGKGKARDLLREKEKDIFRR